jgi:3-oxoacyl-[acyl-carrier protein] reductase
MDLGLSGKSAMVAAASKGIGKAIALSLAREGAKVSISARTPDTLEAARRELLQLAPAERVMAMPCDVTRAADIEQWFQKTVATFGGVDILVTNTGGPAAGRFLELSEEQWRESIDSTLFNVLRLSRLAAQEMKKRRWGRIIHLTSYVAKQPMDVLTISSTLRAGLSALTKTMSNQLAADNILVNAVLPGNVLTDRQTHLAEIRAREEGIDVATYLERSAKSIPLRRAARPEEMGDVVAFLASERASYITGTTLQVDGGVIQSTF